jgi:hypothetical protein
LAEFPPCTSIAIEWAISIKQDSEASAPIEMRKLELALSRVLRQNFSLDVDCDR